MPRGACARDKGRSSGVVRWIAVGLLLVATVVGLFARFYGLGQRPLAEDEYYQIRSVEFILEEGVPTFPDGGYYLRAPILQYAMATAAETFGESALSYRLPSVFFSLLNVVLLYLYASRFVSFPVAAALAAALLLSSWQIEFARFARMYALFQSTTLLFLITFDDALFRCRWRRRYWPHVAMATATLSHQLGVLLAPLLFLPLVIPGVRFRFPSWRRWLGYACVGMLVTLASVAFIQTDWRSLGVATPSLPSDYQRPPGLHSMFIMPAFPFWRLAGDPWTTLGLVLAAGAAFTALLLALRRFGRPVRDTDILAGLLVLFSLAHLFVMCGAIGLILLFRYDAWRVDLHPRRTYVLVGLAFLICGGWLAYAVTHPIALNVSEVALHWNAADDRLLKALWTTFLGWPDFYPLVILPFMAEMPLTGLLGSVALGWAAVTYRHAPVTMLVRHPGFILIYTMICFSVLSAEWHVLRYWFHLYPVWLCLIALMVEEMARKSLTRWAPTRQWLAPAAAAVGFLVLFAASRDFNPAHLRQVASDQVAYRLGPFRPYERTWYERLDVASPGRFVSAKVDADADTRIVVENLPAASYYVHPDYALYYIRDGVRFREVSRDRGTRDLWSGRRLLSTPEELADYTRAAHDVWLIRETERSPLLPEPSEVWGKRLVEQSQAYLSRDGAVEVLHIKLGPPKDASTAGSDAPDAPRDQA